MRIQVLGFIASAAVLVPLAAQNKVPDPRTYDYAGQIAALQAADHRDLASASGSADMAGVPKTFRVRTDIPLTAVAMEAVRERKAQNRDQYPCSWLRWPCSLQLRHGSANGGLRTTPSVHRGVAGR